MSAQTRQDFPLGLPPGLTTVPENKGLNNYFPFFLKNTPLKL